MNHWDRLTPRSSQAILGALGTLTALLGMVVLAGWYGQSPRLVQLSPDLTPMSPHTAVSFLFFGCGLLAMALGRHILCTILAAVVGLSNGVRVIAYTTGLNIHLDRVMHVSGGFMPVTPVAPNTAVCFVLLSAALFLMARNLGFRRRRMVIALLGSAACAVSLISLIGYLSGVRTFEWGQWTPMALHTSLGLTLLGLGVLLFTWREERLASAGGPPDWLFVSAALAVAVLTICLWQRLAIDAHDQTQRAIAGDLAEVRANLLAQMELRTAVLVRAGRHWEQLGKPGQADWDFETGVLLRDVLNFNAVEWVEPDLRIRLVAPRKGNERLLNANIGVDLRRRAAFEEARTERHAVLTRTVDLLTGGRGIQIYMPVFKNGVCQGFVVGIFLVDELIPTLVPPTAAPGEQIEILDGDEPIYTRAGQDRTLARKWGQQLTLDLGGPRWTVRMWPSSERLSSLDSRVPQTVLGTGLLLAGLLGTALFLAQQAWARARAAEAMRLAMEKETSDRRQAEQELDQFFALSLEMLSIIGTDGYFKRLNPAFERVLGYSLEELKAQPFLNFVHSDDREQTAAAARQLANGLPVTFFENRYCTRDGSIRWIQWVCAPAPGRPLYFASARDITERKAAQDALERSHAELEDRIRERTAALEQSNRALAASETKVLQLNQRLQEHIRELMASNQELEAFTYSVSHDLRAPLRHVDGFSKILLEDFGTQIPEAAGKLLERIRQGSQRMGRMVDELLELSRTARREPEKRLTGLRSVVEEVVADLASETGGREVEWRIGELPFADCDPALTRQIFTNLLSNAVKFTRPRPRAVIEIGQAESEGGPALFVRDNGVGFSMKYADKLFAAFQRLHRQEDFEGTGVGLATVQRIVRKHGGRIWAEAALDQGATFYFTLAPPESTASDHTSLATQVLEVHDVTQ